jgi:hypothetical protein
MVKVFKPHCSVKELFFSLALIPVVQKFLMHDLVMYWRLWEGPVSAKPRDYPMLHITLGFALAAPRVSRAPKLARRIVRIL